jgi:hypothetical protein
MPEENLTFRVVSGRRQELGSYRAAREHMNCITAVLLHGGLFLVREGEKG